MKDASELGGGRVRLERDGGVVHVLLNRPEKKNALDQGMFEGLREAALQVRDDRSVRAVVLSGAGDCFCSGLDFSTFGAMADEGLDAGSEEVAAAARDLSPDGANRARSRSRGSGRRCRCP